MLSLTLSLKLDEKLFILPMFRTDFQISLSRKNQFYTQEKSLNLKLHAFHCGLFEKPCCETFLLHHFSFSEF